MIGNILLLLIIIGIVITIEEFRRQKKIKSLEEHKPEQLEPQTNYPYKKKNLFTRTEYVFFNKLNNTAKGKNIITFTKIRLEDFIETTNNEQRLKYHGYIKSRHVDFILCDSNTIQILAAIELDGPSHHTVKAQEIDNFKDELFKAVGVKLFRVKSGADFQTTIDSIISEIRPEESATSDLAPNL